MKRIRDQISNLVYQDPSHLALMKRLTGLFLLCIMPLQLFVVFFFGPYHVPAWRLGHEFICFPEPPTWLSVLVWSLYSAACLALVFGKGNRLIPIFLFSVWFYYQSLDRYIFHSSFVILLSLYLLAFAIDRKPRSLSRLLIRIAVSSCYIFSAAHKFHPEFLSGLTMYDMLGQGNLLRPELLDTIRWLNLPRWFTNTATYLVIALEFFIGLGLWFKSTRIYAVCCGVFMHLAFTIMIPGIELFAPIAWTGYLAFFESKNKSANSRSLAFAKPPADIFVMAAASFLCVFMPARFFFLPRYEYLQMSLYDRVPWGFSMFLFHEEIKSVQVRYQTADERWQEVQLSGRMAASSSDSDLVALAYYIARIHPQALRILVRSTLQVNGHGLKVKECLYVPSARKFMVHRAVVDGMQLRR